MYGVSRTACKSTYAAYARNIRTPLKSAVLRYSYGALASSPGHTQLFQCCTLKNGRAWYLNDIIDTVDFASLRTYGRPSMTKFADAIYTPLASIPPLFTPPPFYSMNPLLSLLKYTPCYSIPITMPWTAPFLISPTIIIIQHALCYYINPPPPAPPSQNAAHGMRLCIPPPMAQGTGTEAQ